MKRKGLTLAEILIVMTIMVVLGTLGATTLSKISSNQNHNFAKFKHTYATVTQIISILIDDKNLYPESSFENTDFVIFNDGTAYSGASKFKDAFAENLNILEEDVEINEEDTAFYTTYTDSNSNEKLDDDEIPTTVSVDSITCFTNNNGVTYCPPETKVLNDSDKDAKLKLGHIFLRVHISSKLDKANSIYFKIGSDGRIEIPVRIENMFDCASEEFIKRNKFLHCEILSKLDEL